MAILEANSIKSNSSSFNSPIAFQTSSGTENGQLARVWVNFNASGTIRASFNVNTVTDNGTGSWTVNFSNSLTDANASVLYTNAREEYNYPYNPNAVCNSVASGNAGVVNWVETVGSFDSGQNFVAVFR